MLLPIHAPNLPISITTSHPQILTGRPQIRTNRPSRLTVTHAPPKAVVSARGMIPNSPPHLPSASSGPARTPCCSKSMRGQIMMWLRERGYTGRCSTARGSSYWSDWTDAVNAACGRSSGSRQAEPNDELSCEGRVSHLTHTVSLMHNAVTQESTET